jgi:AraC-like DNA-binding protein
VASPELAVYETQHFGCSAMTHHRHATPFVTIVVSGGYVEVNDAVPEFCGRGAVVLHRAGEEHADRFASDTRCLNVELSDDWRPADSMIASTQSSALLDAGRSVATAFYRDPSALPAAVRRFHAALQSQTANAIERPEWLKRVMDEFEWTEAVPLREAATLAGLHGTHFSRAFRRHVGMTANEYRARQRVRHASQLLLKTTASISRVAQSCGLSDQSHLTRLFAERLGVSPAAYRRTFVS